MFDGYSLCSLLLRNTRPISSFWPWPLHDQAVKYFQGREILRFREFRCLTGSSLCSLLLRNTLPISPMMIPIPPWLQVKVTKYLDFVNLDFWRVVVCVCFSSETTWPNSPMLMPIYRGNNVDLQHILNFEPSPLHDCRSRSRYTLILWILMGSSLCSLLLRNYSTDFSNADTNLSSEKCRFAAYIILTFTPPWLQVKVTEYFNFVNLGCCLGMNADICWAI